MNTSNCMFRLHYMWWAFCTKNNIDKMWSI